MRRAVVIACGLLAHACAGQVLLQNARLGRVACVDYPAFVITAPQAYQVVQRSGTSADIRISGYVTSGSHSVEARWRGGDWITIAGNVRGAFSGALTNQSQGDGDLELRYADARWQGITVSNVGIGDVYVIAGQSNAMGPGPSNQTNAWGLSHLFTKVYTWGPHGDPTDSSQLGATDAVALNNLSGAGGSMWPLLAGHFATNGLGLPIAFVPCAKDGSSSAQWLPNGGPTNRSSLYGSMVWRAKYAVGGVKAVLWWQGEYEAVSFAYQWYYYSNFTRFSSNVMADMGVKVMPCKLQHCTGILDADQNSVNAAIAQAWAEDSNTLRGPDLTGLTSDDTVHLKSDANLSAAGALWWEALKAAFY